MIDQIEKKLTQAQELLRIAKETDDPERQKTLEGVVYSIFQDIRPAEPEEDEDE